MAKIHYLQGEGTENLAIFEERAEDSMIVSAALGICTYLYEREMTKDQARAYWQELRSQGWRPIASTKTHRDIWKLYQ